MLKNGEKKKTLTQWLERGGNDPKNFVFCNQEPTDDDDDGDDGSSLLLLLFLLLLMLLLLLFCCCCGEDCEDEEDGEEEVLLSLMVIDVFLFFLLSTMSGSLTRTGLLCFRLIVTDDTRRLSSIASLGFAQNCEVRLRSVKSQCRAAHCMNVVPASFQTP